MMMKHVWRFLLFSRLMLILGALAPLVVAQEVEEPVAEAAVAKKTREVAPPRAPDINDLPVPLDAIRGNVLDLERTGYFTVESVAYRTQGRGYETIVWTLRVNKPVTYRHIEMMLREYRDVRFYSTHENTRPHDILATLLYYPERIPLGAANNRRLGRGDEFDVWVEVPTNHREKLMSMQADTMVLRRWPY